MKMFTRFLTFSIILFVCSYTWTQTEPVLSLVTTMKTQTASQLVFEPTGEFEISFWNEEFLQLGIQIYNTELRREQLKNMVILKVFRPETTLEGNCLLLKMPGIERSTFINGNEISWNIRYTIKLPRSIQIVRKSTEISTK